jgi:hypothetical protein
LSAFSLSAFKWLNVRPGVGFVLEDMDCDEWCGAGDEYRAEVALLLLDTGHPYGGVLDETCEGAVLDCTSLLYQSDCDHHIRFEIWVLRVVNILEAWPVNQLDDLDDSMG